MKIAITGATGLIGTNLCSTLESKGHELLKLSRTKKDKPDYVHFNYKSQQIELEKLEGTEVVVHLAGESISGYWSESKKREIETSRVEGTRFLVNSLLKLGKKPKDFISASAVGVYGDRGDEIVDEQSGTGSGFLVEVAKKWEEEAAVLTGHGMRVVNLRIGLVLSEDGGALKQMLLPFKMGFGGRLGSGKQYMSWVMLEDVVGSIEFIIKNTNIKGPVNIVAPEPVTNAYFTKLLGSALKRPAFITVPAFILNILVPEMAKEILLSSTRAVPKKLLESGYKFKYSSLQSAFNDLLN